MVKNDINFRISCNWKFVFFPQPIRLKCAPPSIINYNIFVLSSSSTISSILTKLRSTNFHFYIEALILMNKCSCYIMHCFLSQWSHQQILVLFFLLLWSFSSDIINSSQFGKHRKKQLKSLSNLNWQYLHWFKGFMLLLNRRIKILKFSWTWYWVSQK